MPRMPLPAAAVLTCLALVCVTAAPIVPKFDLSHDVRSTADVGELVLLIHDLPEPLQAAGIRQEELAFVWRKKLKAAGIAVVEEDAPRLTLRIRHLEDEDVPDAAGLLALLLFEQDVTVRRLDERLKLPSYTGYAAGIDARDNIRESFEPAIHGMIDNFIDAVREATADRRRREANEG